MDLDQYAFVMAQVRFASEAELPGVLSRLRMTREKLDQLQAIWKPQLNGNFALSVQYAKALETHKQNLEARRATPGSAAPANVSAPSNVHPGPGAGQKPGK